MVYLYATIKMMHGPINTRLLLFFNSVTQLDVLYERKQMVYSVPYSQKNLQNTANRSHLTFIYSTRRHTTKPAAFPLHNSIIPLVWLQGFCREIDEICTLLGHYAAYRSNSLPTIRYNPSVQPSKFKNPKMMGLIGCLETSLSNYQCTPRNIAEGRRSHRSTYSYTRH